MGNQKSIKNYFHYFHAAETSHVPGAWPLLPYEL